MLLAALRRLALLVVTISALTAGTATLLGLLLGASLERTITLAFYGVGSFLMITGFFVGNRGPARVKSDTTGSGAFVFPLFGTRRLRWATRGEQAETINNSAVFVSLGFILVLVGVAIDTRYSLV